MSAWLNSISEPGRAGEWGLSLSYGNMIEDLWPVAIVCAVSILCTSLWLLAAGVYLRAKAGHGQ